MILFTILLDDVGEETRQGALRSTSTLLRTVVGMTTGILL